MAYAFEQLTGRGVFVGSRRFPPPPNIPIRDVTKYDSAVFDRAALCGFHKGLAHLVGCTRGAPLHALYTNSPWLQDYLISQQLRTVRVTELKEQYSRHLIGARRCS